MITIEPIPELRFISESQYLELINLYHLARTAVTSNSKLDKMIWACDNFCKENPKVKIGGAYKDLSARLEGY